MVKMMKGADLVLLVVVTSELVTSEELIPVSVTRRLGGDSFHVLNSSDPLLCGDDNNLTYLVHERRCVKNQELFSGNYITI